MKQLIPALLFASTLLCFRGTAEAQSSPYPLMIEPNNDEDIVAAVLRDYKPVVKGKTIVWKPTADIKDRFPAPSQGGSLHTKVDTTMLLEDMSYVVTFSTEAVPCDYPCDPVMGLAYLRPISELERPIVAAQSYFTGLADGAGLPMAKDVVTIGKYQYALVVKRFMYMQGSLIQWLGWYDLSPGHELQEILAITETEWSDNAESGTMTQVTMLPGDGPYPPLKATKVATDENGKKTTTTASYVFDGAQHKYVEKAVAPPASKPAASPVRKN